jgi:hypothetical protein
VGKCGYDFSIFLQGNVFHFFISLRTSGKRVKISVTTIKYHDHIGIAKTTYLVVMVVIPIHLSGRMSIKQLKFIIPGGDGGYPNRIHFPGRMITNINKLSYNLPDDDNDCPSRLCLQGG